MALALCHRYAVDAMGALFLYSVSDYGTSTCKKPGVAVVGQVRVSSVLDGVAFDALAQFVRERHGHLQFGRTQVDGQSVLTSEHGGLKIFWAYAGEGEVYLPAGHRTKEGDGEPLPAEYTPDPIDHTFADALDCLKGSFAALRSQAQVPVHAILSRRRATGNGGVYAGEYANDLWKLAHVPQPWSPDSAVGDALAYLFANYRRYGFSEKAAGSYEPVRAGDQLIVAGDEQLNVRGSLQFLTVEHIGRRESHVSRSMRLRYLKDTSGGCNFDFDPFRRLPLTWYLTLPDEQDDGLNFINSHVVNIPRETSPTHFHPANPVNGGLPQDEIYLVLDPASYRLNTYGRQASLVAYPDLHDLGRYEEHALQPGDLVYIPAGVGHRGMDVFANVITIPGFKPNNEYYIDRDLAEAGVSEAVANHNLFHIKNYAELTALI